MEKIYLTAENIDSLSKAILDDYHLGINACSKIIRAEDILTRIYLTCLNHINLSDVRKVYLLILKNLCRNSYA